MIKSIAPSAQALCAMRDHALGPMAWTGTSNMLPLQLRPRQQQQWRRLSHLHYKTACRYYQQASSQSTRSLLAPPQSSSFSSSPSSSYSPYSSSAAASITTRKQKLQEAESEEPTQTDFESMDVLGNTPPPLTAIDACLADGFLLNNGIRIRGGSGCLLVAGEAFEWRPRPRPSPSAAEEEKKKQEKKGSLEKGEDIARERGEQQQQQEGLASTLLNSKGQWQAPDDSWGVLDLVWPRPDILILGLGPQLVPVAPETRHYLYSLGLSLEILDTRNAAAQFNLLATERGVGSIAAALIPVGSAKGRK